MARWSMRQPSRMKANTLLILFRDNGIHHLGLNAFRRNTMHTSASLTSTKHTELSHRIESGILRGQTSLETDSGNRWPKRTPMVMPTDVAIRRIIVMMFALLSLATFRCFAGDAAPPVQICDVLKNVGKFEGRLIELHTDIKVTMHGRYLVGNECPGLGSLSLVINDEGYKNKRIREFVTEIYSNGGQLELILVGYSSKASSDGLNGSFILNDVGARRSTNPKFDAPEG